MKEKNVRTNNFDFGSFIVHVVDQIANEWFLYCYAVTCLIGISEICIVDH